MRWSACAAALILTSCSGAVNTVAVRTTAGLLDRGIGAFYEEPDPQLARDAMPGQLKLLEALLKSDTGNPALLKALAEGYVGYAYLFLEESEPERAGALYRRAARYGLRLAGRNDRLKGLERMSAKGMEEALLHAEKEDVPGLYWTAYAWAGWANLEKNNSEALAALPKAARMMQRVLDLDPAYQFSGADLFFGLYHAGRPKIAGGDPEKGRAHFEAALARTERRFLTAQVLYAEYYAVAALDDVLFRALNEEVQAADLDASPESRLANEIARRRSRRLLERIDELF